MNEVFTKLIENKIEICVNEFDILSRQIFVNNEGEIIHPGEFGSYRERIITELIKGFIPEKYDVGTGFIITSQNDISTQCDIIIFDKENTPVIENNNQRFFPIESVAGVIEVKSVMTKQALKESLIKLSKIKSLRERIEKTPYIYKDLLHGEPYNTKNNVRDQIATFLVCESFQFNPRDCGNMFEDFYNGIDKSLFHNMILSLKDGVFLYDSEESKPFFYPYISYSKDKFENILIYPSEIGYKYEHIKLFINYFYMCISSVSILFVDITNYLGVTRFHKKYKITE